MAASDASAAVIIAATSACLRNLMKVSVILGYSPRSRVATLSVSTSYPHRRRN
jgi:hypothetical protein